MSWEVEGSDVDYKSILILSEMVYVKPMHEDCLAQLVRDQAKKRETAVPLLLCL